MTLVACWYCWPFCEATKNWLKQSKRLQEPSDLILQRDTATGESDKALVVRRAFLDCIISKSQFLSYRLSASSSL